MNKQQPNPERAHPWPAATDANGQPTAAAREAMHLADRFERDWDEMTAARDYLEAVLYCPTRQVLEAAAQRMIKAVSRFERGDHRPAEPDDDIPFLPTEGIGLAFIQQTDTLLVIGRGCYGDDRANGC